MRQEDEAALAAEFEQEADDDEQWEEVRAPVQRGRGTLGTQVTIRLEPAVAEHLRQVARERGANYTTLLRGWIEERLRADTTRAGTERVQRTYAGEAIAPDAVHWTSEGEARLTRAAALAG
jgi:uncharacterized protein (DUF4415 family)